MTLKEYHKKWRDSHPDKIKAYNEKHKEYYKNWLRSHSRIKYFREYFKKYPEKYKQYRNKFFFDGMEEKILGRDNHQCQICGQKKHIGIHHWDENKKNNTYWNLLTLCPGCHRLTHLGFF